LAALEREQSKLVRQIRNVLELMKEGHGTLAMVRELRSLEERHAALATDIATVATAEPMPALHPNLPELYRRKVEALEDALREPMTQAAAIDALRSLIDAILVYPDEPRGKVRVELRGDLAAFMHLPDNHAGTPDRKTAVLCLSGGRLGGVMGLVFYHFSGVGPPPPLTTVCALLT
jgi:hypothetical protein